MPSNSPPPPAQPKREPSPWALAGAGLELTAGVAVFTAIGWWLDEKWQTQPWMLIVGATLGFAGGLYNLWRKANRHLQ